MYLIVQWLTIKGNQFRFLLACCGLAFFNWEDKYLVNVNDLSTYLNCVGGLHYRNLLFKMCYYVGLS